MATVAEGAHSMTYHGNAPVALTCEHLHNPHGIDVLKPGLAWHTELHGRNRRQSAYQVLVADHPALLARDCVNLWDSGKVISETSTGILYDGIPLPSRMKCWWKVRVWDNDGAVSDWSGPASWSMGLLQPSDWKARWLTYVQPYAGSTANVLSPEDLTFTGASWLWYPAGDPRRMVEPCTRYFRRDFILPASGGFTSAWFLYTSDCLSVLFVNGRRVPDLEESRSVRLSQEVNIAGYLRPGRNVIAIEGRRNDTGRAGFICRLKVTGADGWRLTVHSDGSWRAAGQHCPGWEKPEFDVTGWKQAGVLGTFGIRPWERRVQIRSWTKWGQNAASPLFRKTFRLTGAIRSAMLYVCGLGYHEVRLNGAKVGDHVLDPAFTNYGKRALYVTHDVTALVREGGNALGVMLGNGWYNQHAADHWFSDLATWRDNPKLLLQLHVDYAGGSHEVIATDGSWRAATGPVVCDGIRNGEVYDARLEMPGWDTPDYDDSGWDAPQLTDGPGDKSPAPVNVAWGILPADQKFTITAAKLSAQTLPPIKVVETLEATGLSEPRPGVFVFDFGQNIAGWVELTVSGPRGTALTLQYNEVLEPDGTVTRKHAGTLVFMGPFQSDTYILSGTGVEIYEPRFTYHGFRYVQVEGWPGKPAPGSLRARVVHTAFETTGRFECSNPLLNRIQRNTIWSYRGNYHGIPTDCPQREKNGWTGDAHLAAELAMCNFDNSAAYEKWLADCRDDQDDKGALHFIVPSPGWGAQETIDWNSAPIIIAWYLYLYRGNTGVLEANYGLFRKGLDYFCSRAVDFIYSDGVSDWCTAKTSTPVEFTSTVYFHYHARLLSRIAGILGRTQDAASYDALAGEILRAFTARFYKGDGIYANGSQTALSSVLYYDLVPEAEREKVIRQLAADVEAKDYHLDVGILGAKTLFHALSENGRHDLAYRIATQVTRPGYGYHIENCEATTLFEDWSDQPGSRNHIMFGDISAWFHRTLGGINPDPNQPGFKHSIIRPRPVNELDHALAEQQTPYGLISCRWQKSAGIFFLRVTVPSNTTATVYVPSEAGSEITESGHPAGSLKEIEYKGMQAGYALFLVGSGEYDFRVTPCRVAGTEEP